MLDILVTFFLDNPAWNSPWVLTFALVLLVVGGFSFICALEDWYYTKEAPYILSLSVAFIAFSVMLGVSMTTADRRLQAADDAIKYKAWVAARCPMYKSECGVKHKYSCEHKGAVVGRNQVGDISVEAYPTC